MSKLLDTLSEHFPNGGSIPNKFTIGMGQLIHQARIDAGLEIAELAEGIYTTSRNNVEAFEKGEKEVSSTELIYLARVLDKPIIYFFPEWLRQSLNPGYITVEELELLRLFQRLNEDDRQELIAHIRSITNAK